jgi:hypothetical protein
LVPRPIGMRQRRKLRRLHGATRVLREAVDYFVFRIRRKLSGLAAVLQGIDAIVFCGGIGENAWRVRERVLERAESPIPGRGCSSYQPTVPTDEEQMIARHTLALATAGQREFVQKCAPAGHRFRCGASRERPDRRWFLGAECPGVAIKFCWE